MNDEIRELYQEIILDHNRHPRNQGNLDHPTHHALGFNPLCGDKINLGLIVRDNKIESIKFEGQACAICTASTSLMTEAVQSLSIPQAEKLFDTFHQVMMSDDADIPTNLGKLTALIGVKAFPVRVKCATLAWHTLRAALHQQDEAVSTE